METIVSTNPAENYAFLGEIQMSTELEVSQKVAAAQAAKGEWKALGIDGRIAALTPICQEFNDRAEEIASLISLEVGKPIEQARDEAFGYASQLQGFMVHAAVALGDSSTDLEQKGLDHRIVYEPRGATAVITPWNFPFGMAMWGIVPNLLAGNTVVFKTSEECPLTGKLIEDVFSRHNLPEGVFNEVYGDGNVGQQLAEENVDFIWFTGSSRTGQALNRIAAERFIPTMLEMGGSNPAIVFEDADPAFAAARIAESRFQNNGQVCDAVKRAIVHESLKESLIAHLAENLAALRIGHPSDPSTKLGSLVARRQAVLLQQQTADARAKGARLRAVENVPQDVQGAYVAAMVIDQVTPDMRIWHEEVFGPLLPVVSFRSEAEAIQLANDTDYGLGAMVIAGDIDRADRIAGQIDAGTVDVNTGDHWQNDWNPFGGYKQSGNGREHGVEGMQALCQMKVIAR